MEQQQQQQKATMTPKPGMIIEWSISGVGYLKETELWERVASGRSRDLRKRNYRQALEP